MPEQRAMILVVDDEGSSRRLLTALLQNDGYEVLATSSAQEALERLQDRRPDLILTDGMMPQISGFELAARLKADSRYAHLPIIVVTALDDRETRLRALEAGVDDFLGKPIDLAELRVRVRNILRLKDYGDRIQRNNEILETTVRQRTAQLHDSYLHTIDVLLRAAEKKDEETGAHIQRIAYYCKELAQQLGMGKDFVDLIFVASPMHDVGKIGIPDQVLLKPGPLDVAEWAVMRTHTTIGANIIGQHNISPELQMGWEIALGHHERWDGSGYPFGKKGNDIPLSARMMALADVYDALRSKRPYKEPFNHEKAMDIIIKGDGRVKPEHFDPDILAVFPRAASSFAECYAALTDCNVPIDG